MGVEVVGVLGLGYGGSMKKDFDEWNAIKKGLEQVEKKYLFKERRYVLLYQVRMFHTNRFQRRMATVDEPDFNKVKKYWVIIAGAFCWAIYWVINTRR